MHKRPIGELLAGLRPLGGVVESLEKNGCPPVHIYGKGLKGGRTVVDASRSSQFVSAILLAAPYASNPVEIRVQGLVSRPYVDVTLAGMSRFGAEAGWLDEGAFASLVDYDSYWHPDAMRETAKFCTDDTPQLRLYQQNGYLQNIPEIHADLGELVAGKKPGRETPEERTMTVNLGNALDDMAVAPLIYKRAVDKGIGTWLEL